MRKWIIFGEQAAEDRNDVSRGFFWGLGSRLRSFINSAGFITRPLKFNTTVTYDVKLNGKTHKVTVEPVK